MRPPAKSRPRSSVGLDFALASRSDDPELRRLMRTCELEADIAIAIEREPDFFLGQTLEGDVAQTLVAREPDGRLVGMGSRSVRDVWIDGEPTRVGYLGQLRLETAYRGMPRILRTGYALLRELHEAGDARFYLTSIAESNVAARRLLEAGLPGFPTYRPLSELSTLIVSTRQRGGVPRGFEVDSAMRVDMAEIAGLLAHHQPAFQFAPVWTEQDLRDPRRVRGLAPEDFVTVRQGGRLVGCAAVWDQRPFKQVRIHGYAGGLARWRPAVDLAARLQGLPPLPPPGAFLEMGYLSHIATDRESLDVYLALLWGARRLAARRQLTCLAFGLASAGPIYSALRAHIRFVEYRTLLYLVHWPDGAGAVSALGPRLTRPEIAVL